jgi:hypothetical protein
VSHAYTIRELFEWLVYGVVQYARYYLPLVDPSPVDFTPPAWWFLFYSQGDWDRGLGSDGVPRLVWILKWLRGCYQLVGAWVEEVGAWAFDNALNTVYSWTGLPQHGYPTFRAWLDAIRSRVGTWVPAWASDLADAAVALYFMLPFGIRHARYSWSEFVQGFVDDAVAFLLSWLSDTISWAAQAWAWVGLYGEVIRLWVDGVRAWLNWFRSNPTEAVEQWLGTDYQRLRLFAQDALTFYYNLWGQFARDLSEFLHYPARFIIDRLEDELIRRW